MTLSGCLLAAKMIWSRLVNRAKIQFVSEWVNLELTLLDLIQLYHTQANQRQFGKLMSSEKMEGLLNDFPNKEAGKDDNLLICYSTLSNKHGHVYSFDRIYPHQ